MSESQRVKILAISGSLRQSSSNTAILTALSKLAPAETDFRFYNGLAELPYFNPEHDTDAPPDSVSNFRKQLKEADGIIICTPEYARGVPGVLKNALDWVVSSGEFFLKPVAVISVSSHPSGGDKAHESILLTLEMIQAQIPENSKLKIGLAGTKINKNGDVLNASTNKELESVLHSLLTSIN